MEQPENPFSMPDKKVEPPAFRAQFSLAGLLSFTAGSALIFGLLKLMGLGPRATLLVTGMIVCGLAAGAALVATITRSVRDDRNE